ncbi:MAG: HAMP domain-containing histidine kinase [Enterocloster citroniae]|nr:HAMP domain-containing histidine kinase [Enterocloster citroniae]
MRILTNRSIKALFFRVLLGFAVFICLTVASVALQFKNASWCVLLLSVCLGFYVVAVIYMYFCRQGKIMETAIGQIAEFIAGDSNARIECDDEGDLYRLFHEVNSLVSMLNAHAENENRSKNFLKEIISDISHQLKTPLAALNIYNGILQEAGKELSTIAEFTSLSEKELERIEVLVQNLLKMAKLDAGAIVMEKSLCNISEMMDDVQRQFSYRAEQEGKTFLLSGDDDIALFCDQNWMMEAVGNVVKNAFDHTKKGDTICITWRKFATVVQMTVSDNGSGIHPEDYPHIFKRFYRSRFSQSTQGVGLGLPLAKTIIEAHSGTIEVDDTQEHGAIFTMNFLNPTKL